MTAQGSVKKNPRNYNPPPFQFNWNAPFGGFGPATWGQTPVAPAYGYGAGGYVPYGGYGNTPPRPTGYNPYAGYVTTPSLGGAPLGVQPEAIVPQNQNTWYGVAPGDPNVNEGRGVWRGYGGFGSDWDLMLNNPYGYGLTWDQTQEGYTPGASERNAYGQPAGTMAPYNNRRTGFYSGPHNVARIQAGQGDAYWDANGRPLKKNPLKKLKKQGAGVSPAWVNGLAQLNIP